jgi:hypothetical protein
VGARHCSPFVGTNASAVLVIADPSPATVPIPVSRPLRKHCCQSYAGWVRVGVARVRSDHAGLAARLTPIGEGAAIGLLSATGALATVVGNVVAGPVVREFGYPVALVAGVLGSVVAAVIAHGGLPPQDPVAPPVG